jgi:hypothetical protein
MKRNWVRKLIGGMSLTTAVFIFQACYGTPQDFGMDIFIEGLVKSKKTGEPIKGIKVSVADNPQYQYTNDAGEFSFYTESADSKVIKFEDIDSIQNGAFIDKDTTLRNVYQRVHLAIFLEEK